MDSRTAAHVLSEIAALLELRAENRFKSRAYRGAAKAVLALDADDLAPLVKSGELAKVRGIGRATLGVIADLVETGARYATDVWARYGAALQPYLDARWLERRGNRIVLTRAGMLMANEVMTAFV